MVLAFLFSFGIAKASVTSDSLQIQYNSCVKDLARMPDLPAPKQADFTPDFIRNTGQTYDQAVINYNGRVAFKASLASKCESLASQLGINSSVPTKASSTPAPSTHRCIGYAGEELIYPDCAHDSDITAQDVYNQETDLDARVTELEGKFDRQNDLTYFVLAMEVLAFVIFIAWDKRRGRK